MRGSVQAIDLSVLNNQRFVRRPEHRIPQQPAEVPVAMMLPDSMLHGKSRAAQSRAGQGQQECGRELKFNCASHEILSVRGGHSCPPKPLSPTAARVAVILSPAVKPSNLIPQPRHYVRTQNRVPADYCPRGYRCYQRPRRAKPTSLYGQIRGHFRGNTRTGSCLTPATTWRD